MFTNLKMSQDGFEINGLLWIVQQIFPVYEKIGLLSFPNTKEMERKYNLYFRLCQHSTCSWVNRGSKLMQIGANWCWMTCLRRITCVLYCLPSVTCMIYIDQIMRIMMMAMTIMAEMTMTMSGRQLMRCINLVAVSLTGRQTDKWFRWIKWKV